MTDYASPIYNTLVEEFNAEGVDIDEARFRPEWTFGAADSRAWEAMREAGWHPGEFADVLVPPEVGVTPISRAQKKPAPKKMTAKKTAASKPD